MATVDEEWAARIDPYVGRARPRSEDEDIRLVKAIEKQYENQLKRKDEEIQLLTDQVEFLNKRIEDLKNYGALFKEYHGDKI